MKGLVVLGRTGQVATELARLAPEAVFLGRDQADLADPAACAQRVRDLRPRALINAAAYTAVDRAEAEPDLAHAVNAEAPAAVARAAAELGVPFVHFSTDYVFDGSGERPWRETDPTGPLGVYGRSKLAGEAGVAAQGGAWAVMRTSWVFSAHGSNFVRTMLRLGAQRDELRVVADQQGGPTPAAAIAAAALRVVAGLREDPGQSGIYHFAGAPDTSWAGLAAEVMARAGLGCRIVPITTADYPTPARRPLNSRLDCTAIADRFAIARPDWRAGLDEVLAELET